MAEIGGDTMLNGNKCYSPEEGDDYLYQWIQDIEVWCMAMRHANENPSKNERVWVSTNPRARESDRGSVDF